MKRTIFNCPPVGFRLTPTDEEAVACYLKPKNDGLPQSCDIIPECDIYSCLPEELPSDRQYGKRNEFYFFVRADRAKRRKVDRKVDSSDDCFWRASGQKRIIKINETTAKKMNLVLYRKEGSKRKNMNWMMHEYSLVNPSNSSEQKGFVFCRIYKKGSSDEKNATTGNKGKKIPLEGDPASPASTNFSRSDEDLPPLPVEIPSKSNTGSPDSPGSSWTVEELKAYLFSESNAAPAAGSSDFHFNNEDLTASLPEIPSELAAADLGSPDFWTEEDLAVLLAGRPALC